MPQKMDFPEIQLFDEICEAAGRGLADEDAIAVPARWATGK